MPVSRRIARMARPRVARQSGNREEVAIQQASGIMHVQPPRNDETTDTIQLRRSLIEYRFSRRTRSMATRLRAAVAAPLALMLTACLSLASTGTVSAQRTHAPVQLTVAGCWGDKNQDAAFVKVATGFNKVQSAIQVKAIEITNSAKVLTQVSAGNPPDVYFDCSSTDVGQWAANGYVLNLDPYIQSSHFDLSKLNHGAHLIGTYNGHTYALPLLEDTFMLLYNKTLFSQAGITKPPATTEELAADADKLTKKDSSGNLVQLGFDPNFSAGNWFGSWLPLFAASFGGSLVDSSGSKVTANCPACIAALTYETSFYSKYGAANIAKFESVGGPNGPFMAGKLAMMIGGEWTPFFVPSQAAKGFDYGVAAIPHPANRPDLANYGMVGGNPGTIMKGTKHPAEAWSFLSYVESLGPTIAFANVMYNVPQLTAAINSPQLNPEPHFRVFVKYAQGPHIGAFPVLPVSTDYANSMVTIEGLVLHGKMSPKQGLDKLTSDIQTKLDQNL
jgi:multiple sugar transport system substrate-binding protein